MLYIKVYYMRVIYFINSMLNYAIVGIFILNYDMVTIYIRFH